MTLNEFYVLKIAEQDEHSRQLMMAFLGEIDEISAIEEQVDRILVYHDDQRVLLRAIDFLKLSYESFGDSSYELDSLPTQNWNSEWEKSFQPIVIPGFVVVRASFHEPEKQSEVLDLVIDPEMAFGTGHHETTYLVMEQMRNIVFSRKYVLDYGSGTAILAILAEKLGAESIIALDYDQNATRCATKCLNLNDCNRIRPITGELKDLALDYYDVILANINRNVLLDMASSVSSRQKEGGVLVLSGFMENDKSMIVSRYNEVGYDVETTTQQNEWISIKLKKC